MDFRHFMRINRYVYRITIESEELFENTLSQTLSYIDTYICTEVNSNIGT